MYVRIGMLMVWLAWALVACNGVAVPTEEADLDFGNSPDAADGLAGVALSQVYTGENELTAASITVNYPQDWVASGTGTEIVLTNGDATNAAEDAVLITIRPVDAAMVETDLTVMPTPADVLRALTASTADVTLDDIQPLTLGDKAAARGAGTTGSAQIVSYVLQTDTGDYVLLSAISQAVITEETLAIARSIAANLQYEAGAIPTSGS